MQALFLIFYGFQEYNVISKKIRYQVDAFKQCGLDVHTCYYEVCENGERQWMVDNNILVNLGKGIIAKIKKKDIIRSYPPLYPRRTDFISIYPLLP